MIPNITRGDDFGGLMAYLVGPGRHNEHTDQHVVAGDADLFMFYGGRLLGEGEARAMARELDESRRLLGTDVTVLRRRTEQGVGGSPSTVLSDRRPAHVWHVSLSLAKAEGQLSDEQWNTIATQFVDRMGFSSSGGKADCRWIAVRHGESSKGNDHIHIAVSMVRMDGTKASTHNDFRRAQDVCRDLEVEHGLAITGDRSAELGNRGIPPLEYDRRLGPGREPSSTRLARAVRAAAAASVDEAEFVRRARRSGLLIRPRFAQGRTDVVEGYSVALRPKTGRPEWHAGGKLARDLTLPRLRQDWPDSIDTSIAAASEWQAVYNGERPYAPGREVDEPDPVLWARYTDDVRMMREQLQAVPLDDKATWAIVARDGAGVFAAWSEQLERWPGPLAELSTELARSAQIRAHEVRPRPAGMPSLGGTALMVAAASMSSSSRMSQAILLRQMANLGEAVAGMIAARGDAVRAEQAARTLQDQLAAVTEQLPRPTSTSVSSVDPALRELRRFRTPTTPRVPEVGTPGQDQRREPPVEPPAVTDDLDR